MNTPEWWMMALGCCLFVPMTIVLYILMTKAEQIWKNMQWRG